MSKKVTSEIMDVSRTISECLQSLFEHCGEDPQREGLQKTPQRFLKAFEELTQGYRQTLEDITNGALFACDNDAPVIVENIPFFSLCEHHLLPFFGYCTVAYKPNGKVLGVSKLYRIVNLFARRLQLQERLTQQIGEGILRVTNAKGVWVEMTAEHLCVAMRGVQRYNSRMRTAYGFGEPIELSGTSIAPAVFNAEKACVNAESSKGTCLADIQNDGSSGLLAVTTKAFPLKIGCYPEEQTRTTPVTLTLELQLSKDYGTVADDLSTTVDYDALMTHLEKNVLQQRFQLLEYAGKAIYQTVRSFLETHHKQARIRVTLKKSLSHALLRDSRFTYGDF